MVELAVVIDIGEHFVKATYSLEGDGPLVFSCFEILSTVNGAVSSPHLPNTEAVIRQLSPDNSASVQWMQYARSCTDPGLSYFNKKFTEKLSGSVMVFKAARLFVPHKMEELKPKPSDVESLKAFPFLNNPSLLDNLKRELPAYAAKAADLSETIDTLAW